MNYTKITLGELLSHANETIKRNAISILKQLQNKKHNDKCKYCGEDMYGTIRIHHHTEKDENGNYVDVTGFGE